MKIMCSKCGLKPALPSRLKLSKSNQICCTCHNRNSIAAHKRKWQKPEYQKYAREARMARCNPLRAMFRAIGLEQFNLATTGRWNGRIRK